MKHISLFSGIGGFDLASEWMGWENVAHCEWNPFGQKVLKYYWPNAISYHDITKTDFTIHRGTIDIITGGFPCQPYSQAGKRLGKEDERHLWPEMLRAIREIQPRWVVGENVRGLTNWNGGLVFDEVQSDLEAIGYEVTPFLLPACAVDAPHRRDRIWFVAYSDNDGRQENTKWSRATRQEFREQYESLHLYESTSDPNSRGLERTTEVRRDSFNVKRESEFGIIADTNSRRQPSEEHRKEESGQLAEKGIPGNWENFPTQSPVCNGNDGISARLDGITFPKWRNESIKAGGNAIVPQVAHQIFKAIQQYENL